VELRRLAAQAGLVAGLVAYRQEDYGTARSLFENAEQLARDVGDGPTIASVWTARRALITSTARGGTGGRAAVQAIALLDAADAAAGRGAPALVRVWLLCSRAEEAATLGREAAALRDLDAAVTAFANGGPDTAVGFFDHWDEARIAGWRASALLQLGRPEQAAVILREVVQATPRTLPGPRAAVVADLGAAHAAAGEPEPAARLLLEALTTAREGRIEDGVARVVRIRQGLERYADLQAVKELDAALEANG
jgi:tetratricopeptide (TPR) repeat protein